VAPIVAMEPHPDAEDPTATRVAGPAHERALQGFLTRLGARVG
jgi:hypothetical protein